jgi:hypothetical protein
MASIESVVTAQNLKGARRVVAREYKSIRPEDASSIEFQDLGGYLTAGNCDVDTKDR